MYCGLLSKKIPQRPCRRRRGYGVDTLTFSGMKKTKMIIVCITQNLPSVLQSIAKRGSSDSPILSRLPKAIRHSGIIGKESNRIDRLGDYSSGNCAGISPDFRISAKGSDWPATLCLRSKCPFGRGYFSHRHMRKSIRFRPNHFWFRKVNESFSKTKLL